MTSELNKKLKQTSNKKINSFLTIVLFLLIAGFLFFGNSKSSQAAGTCTCGIQKTDQYITTTNTKEECIAVCGGKNPTGFGYAGYNWKDDATGKNEGNAPIDIGKITNSSPIKDNTQVCSGATDWISHPINCSLLSVLKAEGIILSASSRLFQYILDPAKFLKIATHQIVYETWKIVRDLLNVAFIMALLFSAFCTIFQVEKYNYKKILLNLIIMALLVNFSFPITRFIIDVSNIMMYSLIKGLQIPVASNGEIFGKIAEGSLIQHIIAPGQPGSVDTSYLIIGVIFIFILLITLLTIAALMVVRVIALTILIIFSPVAFVGSLLSVGSKYTGQWWDNLFKYAFFGPAMIFMIYVSLKIMEASALVQEEVNNLKSNVVDASFFVSMVFYVIPIVIMWLGIGMAQKMGIAGAAEVTRHGKRFMKWAGGVTMADNAWKAYRKRRDDTKSESMANRLGTWFGSRQDQIVGVGSERAKARFEKDQVAKIKQESERHNMENLGVGNLKQIAQNGNRFERAAAIQAMISKGAFDTSQDDIRQLYEKTRSDFGVGSFAFENINSQIKKFDPVTAFSHITDRNKKIQSYRDFVNSSSFDASKLGFTSGSNSDFLEVAFTEETMNRKHLDDIRSRNKDDNRRKALKKAIETVANAKDENGNYKYNQYDGPKRRIYREIQLANLRISGDMSEAIKETGKGKENVEQMMKEMYANVSADDFKRVNSWQADEKYLKILSDNMPGSRFSSILPAIDKASVAKPIADYLRKQSKHEKYMKNNLNLAGLYADDNGSSQQQKQNQPETSQPSQNLGNFQEIANRLKNDNTVI